MRRPPSPQFLRWLRAYLQGIAAELTDEGKLRNEMADGIGASWRKRLHREAQDLKAEAARLRGMVDRCGKPCVGSCEVCSRGQWTITRASAIRGGNVALGRPRETYYSDEISGDFETTR